MLQVRLVEALGGIDQADWDALDPLGVSGALYSSPAWCAIANESDGVAQRYVIATDGGTLLAVVPVDLVPAGGPARYSLEAVLADPYDMPVAPWTAARPLLPGLVATTRAGTACDVRTHPALGTDGRAALLRRLLDALPGIGEQLGARSTALLYAPAGLAALADGRYASGEIGGNAVLALDVPDIDAFIARMRSRRRHWFRHDAEGLERAGGEIRRTPLADSLDLHARHTVLNAAKYGDHIDVDAYRERLRLIAERFGQDAIVATLHAGGRPVASCHFVRYRRILYARASGSEPDADPRLAAYFNVALLEGIRLALDLGCTHLAAGRGLPDRKVSRGFGIEPDAVLVADPDPDVRQRLSDVAATVRARLDELRAIERAGLRADAPA